MSTVSNEIASMGLYTQQYQNKTDTLTGAASQNLTQADFLNLLTKQLQFQDPMDPQDNSQFVSQMAQFSQLQATTEIDSTLSDFAGFMKANSLIGKDVTVVTSTTTTTGTVSSVFSDGAESGITINGTTYPIKDLQYVFDKSVTTTSTTGGTSTTGTTTKT